MSQNTHPLDRLGVASPCSADWNEMTGNDQVRFCSLCQLNVYNLSGMSQAEAETLVMQNEGRLCVRFFKRADGTLLTRDCPVGLRAMHRRRLKKLGSLAAAVTLMTAVGIFTARSYAGTVTPQPSQYEEHQGNRVIMGEMVAPPHPTPPTPPPQTDPAKPCDKPGTQPCKPPKKPDPQSQNQPPRMLMGKVRMNP